MRTACCAALVCLWCAVAEAQYFQYLYGNVFDNAFTKVIPHGSNYYVIGRDQPTAGALTRAIVARIDGLGQLQWVARLEIASQWNDAVLTPTGDLIMVGHSLPFDTSCQSLLGIVTPAGLFSGQAFDVPGRDFFNRIVHNPVPDNPSFPYYILGAQWEPGGSPTWDDVVLLTVNAAGAIGWKRVYSNFFGSIDDEFVRDLEALPNGELIIAGSLGPAGVVFQANNTGAISNAAGPAGGSFTFIDVTPVSNGYLALGHTFPTFQAHLMKFDNTMLPVWQVQLPSLTAVRNVWQTGSSIYVSGSALVGGLTRGVVLRFLDAPGGPVLQWMKYLHENETAYSDGAVWPVSSTKVAYADGRTRPNGFGGECAFLSVSDLELRSCMTLTGNTAVAPSTLLFNSPVFNNPIIAPMPTQRSLQHYLILWQQDAPCCLEDFETNGTGSWQTLNGSISAIFDPNAGSIVLRGDDGSGPSWMYNGSTLYQGDWTQKFNNKCLCFDIRYDSGDPINAPTGNVPIFIYQGTDPLAAAKRASFTVNMPIGNAWTKVCVPVGLTNGTAYPSNQCGQWTSTSFADFDMIITGVSGIGIPLDFAGGASPSEKVFVDNFCLKECECGRDTCCLRSPFQNMSYRPHSGPNQPISCRDLAIWQCQFAVFQLSGGFQCPGGACAPMPGMSWTLTHPNLPPHSGTMLGPSFTVSIPNSLFPLPGVYTLTLAGICGNDTCHCEILIETPGCTVSTHDASQPQRLHLFPSPTPGHFTLELTAPAPAGTSLRIVDPIGRLVLEMEALPGSEQQQVQAHALPAGLYVVQVVQEGRVVGVSRFAKQ